MTNIIPMTNMGNEWLIYPMDYGDYIHQPIVNIWLIYGNQYFHKVVPPQLCLLVINPDEYYRYNPHSSTQT